MLYKFILFTGKIYTRLLSGRFSHFGKNSIIKPFLNSANEQYISIGDNVNIGSFCRITVSTEFGGYKCSSKNKIRLSIGNDVDINNNSFISANNDIEIGNHVMIGSYVFITDHDHTYQDVTKNLHEQPLTENGHTKIGDNVFLGTKSSILKNVTIGEHSVVAANSVVTTDVPPFSIAVGNPAKIVRWFRA